MIKNLLILFFLLPAGAVFAVTTNWGVYCPIGSPQAWEYGFFSKKECAQKDNIQAFMTRKEGYDGFEYFVYEVPSRRMYYYLAQNSSGIYVKAARVCLPVLEFINLNITFSPPVCVLKFPFTKGGEWRYDGIARVHAFMFFDIEKNLTVRFKMFGAEYLSVAGKRTRAFHIFAVANRRWESATPVNGHAWFAKNIGVVRAETENSLLELTGYSRNFPH